MKDHQKELLIHHYKDIGPAHLAAGNGKAAQKAMDNNLKEDQKLTSNHKYEPCTD